MLVLLFSAYVQSRCGVGTYECYVYLLIENFDTRLLAFLKVMLISLSILMECLKPLKGRADKCLFVKIILQPHKQIMSRFIAWIENIQAYDL